MLTSNYRWTAARAPRAAPAAPLLGCTTGAATCSGRVAAQLSVRQQEMTAAVIVITATSLVLATIYAVRQSRLAKAAQAIRQANLKRQLVIQSLIEQNGAILKDESLSSAEIRAATAIVLSELRAMDVDGVLVPLIEDEESYIEEQLSQRSH